MPESRVLLIEHERVTPAGLVTTWLEHHKANVQVLPIDEGARPDSVEEYDLIVSLGSEFSAYDDHISWLPEELALMQRATQADVPVLGICFGGQLLARALGGEVFRAEKDEIGWFPVETKDPSIVEPGPWFQWHFDTFSLPEQAELIASNEVGVQAFTWGRSLGLQFHPEVGVEMMEKWVVAYRHELDEYHVPADALLQETRDLIDQASAASWRLLNNFAERSLIFTESS